MRARLMTIGITAAAIIALALLASPQAIAQGNANKPAPAKKAKPAATKPPATAPAPAATPAATPAEKPAAAKKPVHRKKKPAMAGIPSGVGSCIKHLSEMAAKDPLIAYEGHPEEVVNNGLLWNDPKSKCYASDDAMRKKIADLVLKWRMHDAAAVRSILQELDGMAPK